MKKVSLTYSHGTWIMDICPDDTKLGMEYQDSDDQCVIHEKRNVPTLKDAVKFLQAEYKGYFDENYYNRAVEKHCFFYTQALAQEYPEVKETGWDEAERLFKVRDFSRKLDGSVVSADLKTDKEAFEKFLAVFQEFCELLKNGNFDLADENDTPVDYIMPNGKRHFGNVFNYLHYVLEYNALADKETSEVIYGPGNGPSTPEMVDATEKLYEDVRQQYEAIFGVKEREM